MNNPLRHIRAAAEHIRLSEVEKTHIRNNLIKFMRASMAPEPIAAPSPYFFFAHRFAVSFAAFLVLIFGTGTAYAAQGALPGSVLYPVKIYVNENIQGALAFSDEAKVSFHTNVAEERLKEAEALADEGKLDTKISAEIEDNFNEHVAKADDIANDLEEKDPASGVEAKIALDSSLNAHSSILAHIGEDSNDKETKANSSALVARARSHGNKDKEVGGPAALKAAAPHIMSVIATDTASITSTSTAKNASTTQLRILTQLQKKANVQLEVASSTFAAIRSGLDATTTAKITAQLSTLNTQFKTGTQQLQNKNYDAAKATLSAVLKGSLELEAFIEASKTYKKNILRSWWGDSEPEPLINEDKPDTSTHHGILKVED